jgi:hypothetical protein
LLTFAGQTQSNIVKHNSRDENEDEEDSPLPVHENAAGLKKFVIAEVAP